MPRVQFPDGSAIDFPEGTDEQTINRVSAETWARVSAGASMTPAKPQNPYAGKSLEDLKSMYQQQKKAGAPSDALSAISDAYVSKEQEGGGLGLAIDDTIRQLAKGTLIGGGLDELSAATSSLFGGDYDETLDYQRARDRFIEKGAPVLSTGLQLTGGIASAGAGAKALGLTNMGVNSARPLAQRMMTGAAIAAPIGATDAFLRGEGGAGNRATDAVVGGVIGAGVGAAVPAIGQGVSSAYSNVKNYLAPNASYKNLGVSRQVGEEMMDLMGADAGPRGLARIRAAGPSGMIADAGPNAGGLADAVITKRGPGANVMIEAVEDRAKKSSKSLTDTLNRMLGAPEGKAEQITTIREGSAAAREAAYNTAYSQPIDYAAPAGQKIVSLFQRIPGEAWGYANKLMKVEGSKSKQILFEIADDGTVSIKRMPDVRQLDYVKRALDAVAEAADQQGRLGGQTAMGRAFKNLSTELRNGLKIAVPQYGAALQSAADPISRIEGIKLGVKVLSPQYTRSELAEALEDMTKPERDAVVSGIRAQLDEMMANVRGTASDPEVAARQLNKMMQELTSDATRKKISMVFGDPKKTMQFFREIGQAFKSAQLRASVAANSKTATRTQAIQGIDERLRPGPVGRLMEGDAPSAMKGATQILTGATPRQMRLRNNEQWLELARLLSEKRGREAEALLRKLITASKVRAQSSAAGQQLGRRAATTVAGTVPVINEEIR